MDNKEFISTLENEVEIEVKEIKENEGVLETVITKENETVQEYGGISESGSRNRKKKTKLFQALTTTTTTLIVGGALIGVTNLVNVNMDASFMSLTFEDSLIKYELNVKDVKDDNELIIYLYDESENEIAVHQVTEDIKDDVILGAIEIDIESISSSLENNEVITYYAELKGDVGLDIERSFDRYRLEISSLTSVFNLVTHRCNCSEDGYYYFKMDFVDDYGLFTDFNAYIIDAGGNEFKCELSDNLHEEQRIYVRTARGGKGKLIIEYLANGEKQVIELEIVI